MRIGVGVNIAYAVSAALLALVLAFSGYGKLTHAAAVVQNLDRTGVPRSWYPWLATAEFAGAAGLVAGIWLRPLGVAAAVGAALYFVGAVVTHLVNNDAAGVRNPAPLLIVSIAVTTLGVLTV
ncbi:MULTISPECIES: DoxX family protein [Pseudonocardia]|uniref:DoxX n=2 Tax=Pseudonocardia TaxID=1847 RepID=A0A1Y2MJ44_PSEAH|nr:MULTISPECIES: DoxX family protein [Pseudonocardia]OSY35284.1 hypothetical protein BG845_06150 [Pseudonocardia autotrophica]TDN73277.1 DoxX-like protein [Pseudonocardia autotrophica]BBG04013.1 membrane protein [Pseudonocardia autotrophica]GEC27735.1 membrane protein [Pseudonocardia saturnea]